MQDNNDSNAGAAVTGTSDSSASGSQGANPVISSGTPDNQNGTQTDPRDAKISTLSSEVKRLNQAIIDAKRGSRNNNNPQNGQDNGNAFDTPEGQYGIAIQLATGNLRNKMENILSLYPELPSEEVSRIRKNPWAFAGHDTFINADWETAALEIEQAMLARAEEIEAAKTSATPATPTPADVNANPAPGTSGEDVTVPGTPEDNDPWTMPLDKLKAQKDKAVAKVSQSK